MAHAAQPLQLAHQMDGRFGHNSYLMMGTRELGDVNTPAMLRVCGTPANPLPFFRHPNGRRTSQFRSLKLNSPSLSQTAKKMSINNNSSKTEEKIAVVTGANKGIGLETVRQLARQGATVVLTARDEKRGIEAMASITGHVIFHQLDVRDPDSVASLAQFIQTEFGRLDILVNNAAATGVIVDVEGLKALKIDPVTWLSGKAKPTNMVQGVIQQTYEAAEICFDTNYYGCKRVTESLIPLLQRSTFGARIVNVSSLRSELWRIPNEETRNKLANVDNLTEEGLETLLQRFLEDLKHDVIEAKGWCMMLPAYSISKAVLNGYTRVLAKRYPDMCINCVHPGFVDTDLTWHTGTMTVEEGAKGPVMLALLPNGSPSGRYFFETEVAEF
ncbi:(+)-neomenthol dehydrogenase-like isoform X2 [Magnolia sinica]|uniref:(+)-neomenthol dehydrogenase-like isoform X2 n=1 Tax=Magnolia sinica TaxID=86752 RepID=UPI00265820C6|nr:(+)-neomenthol dehydrogenase-like isoform X2 [Magnolia sinica]